jgi:hypothetical protein
MRPYRPPREARRESSPRRLDPDRLSQHTDRLYRAAWSLSELLARAHELHPRVKRVLLVDRDYSSTSPAVQAMSLGRADCHVVRAWADGETMAISSAAAETFFATLKTELVYRPTRPTRREVGLRRVSSTSRRSTTEPAGSPPSATSHPPNTNLAARRHVPRRNEQPVDRPDPERQMIRRVGLRSWPGRASERSQDRQPDKGSTSSQAN